MKNSFRHGKALFAAFLLVVTFAVPGVAGEEGPSPEAALAFAKQVVHGAVDVLRDSSLSIAERNAKLEKQLRAGFDLDYISRFVLGRHWRKATPEEREAYRKLFADFTISTYSGRLDEYANEEVVFGAARPAGKRDVLIEGQIVRRAGDPLVLEWRIRKRAEGFKVIDLKVEGISLAISQREEFSSVVQQNGIEGLLQALRDKINANALSGETASIQ